MSLSRNASRARAAGAKPLQPERARSALSAKRLVFSKDFLLFLSRFVVFFPNVRVSSRRSLASEGCRGEAPAARASERRQLHPTLRAFSFFASGRSREAVTESIGRDARVRENLDVCFSVTRLTFHGSQELEFGYPGKVKSLLLL